MGVRTAMRGEPKRGHCDDDKSFERELGRF